MAKQKQDYDNLISLFNETKKEIPKLIIGEKYASYDGKDYSCESFQYKRTGKEIYIEARFVQTKETKEIKTTKEETNNENH